MWLSLGTYGPAFVGAATALVAKPFVDWAIGRYRETMSYRAHMADRIRDFRESIAVLDSIRLLRRASFPVDAHLGKLMIPDHLVSAKAVDASKLTLTSQAEGIQLSNQLANINQDVKSLLTSKSSKNELAFYLQADELAEKLRNLSASWEDKHQWAKRRVPAPSSKRKEIMFENGEKGMGVNYTGEKPTALPD
ncbi:hypothetical protein [Sphingomonas sp. S6]|jgi:hypothetical protein|uniref:hypothetical protein n=1 Tax=Sphingomonas sp. S6 TaxID=3368600 RepID=UPI000FABD57B|nr:hypothetical protein [uncultured Sphingomonas sp.]RTL17451.1 MAG: hypothetical protein EKK50_09385 [Sphingomonadaceae bacterium]